jgi:hypothetical protein
MKAYKKKIWAFMGYRLLLSLEVEPILSFGRAADSEQSGVCTLLCLRLAPQNDTHTMLQLKGSGA